MIARQPQSFVAHVYLWRRAAGFLVSVDSYMNLQLANAEEYIDGNFAGNLGEILIRYEDMYCFLGL